MTKLDFPDTPSTGQQFGSAGTIWRWDGTRWGSTNGAAGARGLVAYSKITASQGGIAGLTDIVGLSCTFTADPSRRYRLTFEGLGVVTAANMATVVIANAAGVQQVARSYFLASNGQASEILQASVVVAGLSGTQTFKVQAYPAGSALQISANPTTPAEFYVEDITYEAGSGGPAAGGWPLRYAVGVNLANISIMSSGAVQLSAIASLPCKAGDVLEVQVSGFATMIAGTTATVMRLGIEASGGGISHQMETSADQDQCMFGGGGGQTQQIPMFHSKIFTTTSDGTFSAGSRGRTTSPGTSGHAIANNRCQITRISP